MKLTQQTIIHTTGKLLIVRHDSVTRWRGCSFSLYHEEDTTRIELLRSRSYWFIYLINHMIKRTAPLC